MIAHAQGAARSSPNGGHDRDWPWALGRHVAVAGAIASLACRDTTIWCYRAVDGHHGTMLAPWAPPHQDQAAGSPSALVGRLLRIRALSPLTAADRVKCPSDAAPKAVDAASPSASSWIPGLGGLCGQTHVDLVTALLAQDAASEQSRSSLLDHDPEEICACVDLPLHADGRVKRP